MPIEWQIAIAIIGILAVPMIGLIYTVGKSTQKLNSICDAVLNLKKDTESNTNRITYLEGVAAGIKSQIDIGHREEKSGRGKA